jgi:DNA polymerase-3 subunit chi
MTRVDFYVSPEPETQARRLLACRLTEKAYKLGKQVYIHTDSESESQLMDDLLWSFRQGSFIPHQLYTTQASISAPVLIGHHQEMAGEADVLINLTQSVPDFFSQFNRVAELVNENPDVRLKARERYQFYRDRGYDLNTFKL